MSQHPARLRIKKVWENLKNWKRWEIWPFLKQWREWEIWLFLKQWRYWKVWSCLNKLRLTLQNLVTFVAPVLIFLAIFGYAWGFLHSYLILS